jgi:uncharacterized protein
MSWGSADHIRGDRIDAQEGLELLMEGQVGRLVYVEDGIPVVEHVAYRVVDGQIIIRTGRVHVLDAAQRCEHAALEVDDDVAARFGTWTVQARGGLSEVTLPADVRTMDGLWFLPQPEDVPPRYVRLTPETVYGERRRYERTGATLVLDLAEPHPGLSQIAPD